MPMCSRQIDTWIRNRWSIFVDKSFWYLLHFIWQNNQWTYASKADTPGELSVRGISGHQEHRERLEPSEACETLGIWLTMDGNNINQIDKMQKKGKLFADHIQTSNLTPSETWHAFKTTIMKTFEYPMEAINLTKVNWDYIMAKKWHCSNISMYCPLCIPHTQRSWNYAPLSPTTHQTITSLPGTNHIMKYYPQPPRV